jgi:hypothetical protein
LELAQGWESESGSLSEWELAWRSVSEWALPSALESASA